MMKEPAKKSSEAGSGSKKVTVTKNGPCIVTGGIPLIREEICNDDGGFCRTWRKIKIYPVQ